MSEALRPIAEVKESSAGPELLVLGVQVRWWFGTIHNETAHELASRINAAWNTRPTEDALVALAIECRDHLYLQQDMDRVRDIARAALEQAGVE